MSDTRIVWKPYVDYEKEEAWLNAMAAEGWELTSYTWMRYRFERGLPGRYTYRIQLLAEGARHPKSREYLSFVEEAGVEVVTKYGRWVYFRKKTADGPFELFSDLDSRIAHHKRVATMFGVVGIALMPSALNMLKPEMLERLPWIAPLVFVELALLGTLAVIGLRESRKAKALERQRALRE